jgi:hypothetical protein
LRHGKSLILRLPPPLLQFRFLVDQPLGELENGGLFAHDGRLEHHRQLAHGFDRAVRFPFLAKIRLSECELLAGFGSRVGLLLPCKGMKLRNEGRDQFEPSGDHAALCNHRVSDRFEFHGGALDENHLQGQVMHQMHVQRGNNFIDVFSLQIRKPFP